MGRTKHSKSETRSQPSADVIVENGSGPETGISSLPTEVLEIILNNIEVWDLIRSCIVVCKRWNAVSKQVILSRVKNIDSIIPFETKKDLKSHITLPLNPSSNTLEVTPKDWETKYEDNSISSLFLHQLQNIKLLLLFERTFIGLADEVSIIFESLEDLTSRNETPVQEKAIVNTMFKVSEHDYEPIAFMSCHNLILHLHEVGNYIDFQEAGTSFELQIFAKDAKKAGYGETSQSLFPLTDYAQSLVALKDYGWKQYDVWFEKKTLLTHLNRIECGNIYVYENNVLAKGYRNKAVVWMTVYEISHDLQKLVVEGVREIYTPFYVADYLYFNEKIYILYENTRFLGLWKSSSNQLTLSDTSVPQCCSKWSFCRLNNLIFLAPQTQRETAWMVLDGNQDNLVMYSVNMVSLINELETSENDEVSSTVQKIFLYNTIFIAVSVCNPPEPDDDAEVETIVKVAIMKRVPKIEDFLSVETFKSLFYLEKTKTRTLMGEIKVEPFHFRDAIFMLWRQSDNDDTLENTDFILKVVKNMN